MSIQAGSGSLSSLHTQFVLQHVVGTHNAQQPSYCYLNFTTSCRQEYPPAPLGVLAHLVQGSISTALTSLLHSQLAV